jgi:hypothetical protein
MQSLFVRHPLLEDGGRTPPSNGRWGMGCLFHICVTIKKFYDPVIKNLFHVYVTIKKFSIPTFLIKLQSCKVAKTIKNKKLKKNFDNFFLYN